MTASIGYGALVLGLILSLLAPLTRKRLAELMTPLVFCCVSLAFASLLYAHSISDFSIENVYLNSHTAKPLLYKISGTWGNHEGSMLLWVWLLSLCSLLYYALSSDATHKMAILAVQHCLTAGFLAFIVFTSNPFVTLSPVPANGRGLNPLLQDIGLAMHPPGLYLGYVGFSLAFSAAIIALIRGELSPEWAKRIRPWVLFSWTFLSAGIGLGSWWAYRELGWGGFWFWDPVENASLMPWLAGTALIHSLMITEKRGSLKSWTLLLALFTFCLSLLGTFLVRSGVLTSVHSFATDPARGMFILIFLSLIAGGALLLFAVRGHHMRSPHDFALLSRDTTLLLNNLLLVTSCITIMLGTLYPLFYETLYGGKISVGEPYFRLTFVPIMLPLVILAGVGPMLKWQKDSAQKWRLYAGGLALVVVMAAVLLILRRDVPPAALLGFGAALYLVASIARDYARRVRLFRQPLASSLQLSAKLPGSFYGMALAHLGLALMVIGITAVNSWGMEKELVMMEGQKVELAGYQLHFHGATYEKGSNFIARKGHFTMETQHGDELAELLPETRYYPVEKSQTTESAIYATIFADRYVVIGDETSKEHFAVRLYYRPFISWIWGGVALMVLGGLMAIAGRKNAL
jgi:cytochrome c-type biogenesis protein CcmF